MVIMKQKTKFVVGIISLITALIILAYLFYIPYKIVMDGNYCFPLIKICAIK